MKKVFFLVVIFLFTLAFHYYAFGEEPSEPHQLWGLSYKHDAKWVQSEVLSARGIVCDYSYYPKSKLLPAYGKIESINDDENFLYGYSFHFEYYDNPARFHLKLRPTGSLSDRIIAIKTIADGLSSKYGTPDHVFIEYYSKGLNTWIFQTDISVHEIAELKPDFFSELDIESHIVSWPHYCPETQISLYLYFFNIEFSANLSRADSEKATIEIIFYSSKPLPKKPVYEKCLEPSPTKEPVNQTGF